MNDDSSLATATATLLGEPPRLGDDRDLAAEIEELGRQVQLLRGRQNETPGVLAADYGRFEAQWLRLAAEVGRREPRTSSSASHPLLGQAEAWQRTAEQLGLEQAVNRGHAFVRQCAADDVTARKELLAPLISEPELAKLFDGLSEVRRLELELGRHLPATDEEGTNDLKSLREQLRTAFIAALAVNPPDDELRDRWRTELADRCDFQLSAVDDLPLDRAAAQLNAVGDDVEWHLRHVETQRSAARRRLSAKARRLRAEFQERTLQHRLENRFGAAVVARSERLMLLLIFAAVALLIVEMTLPLSDGALLAFTLVDTVFCSVFLAEFAVKLWHAPRRLSWFARHFLIDFLPSIPFGLLTLPEADPLRVGRVLRVLRMGRLIRYVRILRPLIRVYRALAFLCRGMDRLVRRHSWLLNRNVILYPTREERLQARRRAQSEWPRLRRLQRELHQHWISLVARVPAADKESVAIARFKSWESARKEGHAQRVRESPRPWSGPHDVPLDGLIRRLAGFTPQDVEQELDQESIGRLARVVRTFSRRPLCWLPVIRSLTPRITAGMSDSEVVSAAAQSASRCAGRYYERWLWTSDLYGTVTPSQVIDRLGNEMVRRSIGPATRLAMLSLLFALTQLMISFTQEDSFHLLRDFLDKVLGPALMLLGSVCLIVLGFGWWLRRIAQRATEFYERAAHAQFLPLTETIRCRHLEQAAQLLHERVLAPEWRLQNPAEYARRDEKLQLFLRRIKQSLLGELADAGASFGMLDRVVLLYRDSLNGAPFGDSDVRTTTQLLGNPAIRQILELSRRVARKDARLLETLDLDRQKSLWGGPYLWFNCLSRSIAHSVACALVEYNRHAIPLDELPLAAKEERQRYDAWLGAEVEGRDAKVAKPAEAGYVSTAFTALHFLDYDAQRDNEVQQRFGPRVLNRLRRDRSLIIRRVFGAYPWHRLPRDERVLNLYAWYVSTLSGGRALLLPFALLWRGVRICASSVLWVRDAVREILHPEQDYSAAADADFATAVRKIQRMRGPIVLETMRLRAKVDPEYLGVPLPAASPGPPGCADLDADLKFLEADASLHHEMQRLRARAEADMRRLSKLIEEGLLERVAQSLGLPRGALSGPEHMRAAGLAYLADYRGLRSLLSAREILHEVYQQAPLELPLAPFPWPRFRLRRAFHRYWREHGYGARDEREAAWRATVHDQNGVAAALRAWSRWGDAAPGEGERALGELLRHPGRISEQLVTLRTVQTLALLDILHYREHVYELGRYEELGDEPGELLVWGGRMEM